MCPEAQGQSVVWGLKCRSPAHREDGRLKDNTEQANAAPCPPPLATQAHILVAWVESVDAGRSTASTMPTPTRDGLLQRDRTSEVREEVGPSPDSEIPPPPPGQAGIKLQGHTDF